MAVKIKQVYFSRLIKQIIKRKIKGKCLCWKSYASLFFESMFHEKYLNVFQKVCVFIYAQARQMRHMATKTSFTSYEHLCVCNVFVFQGPCHVTLDIFFFFSSNIAPTAGQRGTEHMGGIKTGDL